MHPHRLPFRLVPRYIFARRPRPPAPPSSAVHASLGIVVWAGDFGGSERHIGSVFFLFGYLGLAWPWVRGSGPGDALNFFTFFQEPERELCSLACSNLPYPHGRAPGRAVSFSRDREGSFVASRASGGGRKRKKKQQVLNFSSQARASRTAVSGCLLCGPLLLLCVVRARWHNFQWHLVVT
ncbi:unnamed protein product [Prorocentrum cordatum]|uniref:Uncharacterized protein n=1 Tax=Prorocentrum cordatum TaxID=2364126 RepID=A0ABN9Y7M4_9DINO|nr:unnamed protein product [Polarella glacialis]